MDDKSVYKFDTLVQHLKYQVLRATAKHAWDGDFYTAFLDIPKEIIPGKTPSMRCCVYKERAILAERVKLAAGGDRNNPNVIEAIDIACDDCPTGGFTVTDDCRGCIAHRCAEACPRGAISHDEHHHAHIDKSKCVNCGRCASACPYGAIHDRKRPCQNACKIGAISMNEDGTVKIDNDKCVSCGACVYMCPWGAVSDKSFILDVIKMLRLSDRVYAIVAPAIASQFSYAKPGQVFTAIKELGFCKVVEAALGADMVAYDEAAELAERGFMTSSCCPAFVTFIKKQFPELEQHISHNMSPMATIAKRIKELDPEAKTVFIGPCTAKKREFQQPEIHKYVDCVLTFEELQALIDSRDIDISTLEESELNDASNFGRIFAHTGGLAVAAQEALKEQGSDFELKPIACSGIDECRAALLKASKGRLDANFIEGMACIGGCVNGSGNLTHAAANYNKVEVFSKKAAKKSIKDSLDVAKTEFDPTVEAH